jgi:hypothetical protein
MKRSQLTASVLETRLGGYPVFIGVVRKGIGSGPSARNSLPERTLEKAQRDIREATACLARQRTLSAAMSSAGKAPSPTARELVRDMEKHRAEFGRRLSEANARLDRCKSKKPS